MAKYCCETCDKEYKTKQSLQTHYKSKTHENMINGVKKNYCFYCKYQARDSVRYRRHCKSKKHLRNEDITISKIKKDKDKYTEEELEELEDKYLFGEDNSLKSHSKYKGIYVLYKKEVNKWRSIDKKLDKIQFCLDNFSEIMKQNKTEMLFKNLYEEWELISIKQYGDMLMNLCRVDNNKDNKISTLYKIKNKLI